MYLHRQILWVGRIYSLRGQGGGVGNGMGLNESDQKDEGRCNGTWISDFLGVNHGIQALLPEECPLWGAK